MLAQQVLEQQRDRSAELPAGHRWTELRHESLDVPPEVGSGRVPRFGVVGERSEADSFQLAGYVAARATGRRDVSAEDAAPDFLVEPTLPQALSDHGLPQHDSDGEDIGSPIDAAAAELLRRHVAQLAAHGPGLGLYLDELGHSEIQHLDLALEGDEHVVGDMSRCTTPSAEPS